MCGFWAIQTRIAQNQCTRKRQLSREKAIKNFDAKNSRHFITLFSSLRLFLSLKIAQRNSSFDYIATIDFIAGSLQKFAKSEVRSWQKNLISTFRKTDIPKCRIIALCAMITWCVTQHCVCEWFMATNTMRAVLFK